MQLIKNTSESNFLFQTPWYLDAFKQNHQQLFNDIVTSQNFFSNPEKNTILFSFITPTWNTEPNHIEELILSLRLQSYPNWEVIFVDDSSNKKDHIPVIEKWSKKDSRIKFLQKEHGGISSGRNTAIKETHGDFILILDHDDIIHPQTLEIFYEKILENNSLNFIYSNELKMLADSKKAHLFFGKTNFSLFNLSRANYVCHLTAIKKSFLLEYGETKDGIFRSQFDGAEDHDLFLRLALTGKVCALHVPLFLYHWRMAATSTAYSMDTKPKAYANGVEVLKTLIFPLYDKRISEGFISPPGICTCHNDLYSYMFSISSIPKIAIGIEFEQIELLLETLDCLALQNNSEQFEIFIYGKEANFDFSKFAKKLNLHFVDFKNHESFASDFVEKDIFKGIEHILFLTSGIYIKNPFAISSLAIELETHKEAIAAGLQLKRNREKIGFFKIGLAGSGYFGIEHTTDTSEHINDQMLVFGISLHCLMLKKDFIKNTPFFKGTKSGTKISDLEWILHINQQGFKTIYLGNLTAKLPSHFSAFRETSSPKELIELNQVFLNVFYAERLNIISSNTHSKWNEIILPIRFLPHKKIHKIVHHFVEKLLFQFAYPFLDGLIWVIKKTFSTSFIRFLKKFFLN